MNAQQSPLIVHVIHHLVIGGMETGLVNIINRMRVDEFRHAIICIEDYSDFKSRLARDDVNVYAMHRSRVGVWRLRHELFSLFRRLRPAIVHTRNLSAIDAILPARLAGVRHLIHGEHGWDSHDPLKRNRHHDILRRVHAPFVSRYVTVSKDLGRWLVSTIGINADRIEHIQNGVDTDLYRPSGPIPSGLVWSRSREEGRIVFGTVGRLVPVKNHEGLIRDFASLLRTNAGLSAELVIIGDGPLRGRLEGVARECCVQDRVHFHGASNQVAELLRTFDVFVLPSINEGTSNTVLEAMASGLPVIATAVGGNPDLVCPGETGFLYDPGKQGALANLMSMYVADPDLRARHARRSRERAETTFGLGGMADAYSSLYQRVNKG